MADETCNTCEHSYANKGEGRLYCRRFPPQATVIADAKSDTGIRVYTEFPCVLPTTSCGEHPEAIARRKYEESKRD